MLLSLLQKVSVLSSDFCKCALFIQGSALAQGSSHRTGLELLLPPQLWVRAFLPSCLHSLPQEMVEIISGEPLETILCS